MVRGSERTLVFPGDVLPTAAHVPAPYNMAYDLFPLDNRESKGILMRQAAREGWLVVLGHEPGNPLRRCVVDGDWFRLEEVAD